MAIPPTFVTDNPGSFDKVGVYVFELIAIDKAGEEAVLEEHRINAVEQQVAEKFFTLSPDAPTSFFVSASSGVIFGQFETAGPYKFSLVARDDGGQTYVVEIFEFVVEERRTFELKLKTQRTQTSDQSFFHADFLGQQSSRSIKFSLIAVDKGGKTAVVEELEFKVTKRATLKVVTVDGKRKFNGTEYTDPKFSSSSFGGSDQLYVGTPYRFSPEIIDAEKTVVSKGTVDDITYALSADAPDSFLINSGSGVVFGIFPKRGNYVFDLIAIDKGLQQQSVETFAFQLNDPNPFEFEIYKVRACNKGTTNPSCRELGFTDPKTEWGNGPVVGTTYSIAPFKTNTLRTKVSAGEVEDITYKLSDGTPDTFLVSSSSGRVVCTFPSSGQYVFSLIAVDAGGKEAVVEEFDVTAQEAVTFQVITIPGMRLCGNATGDGCGDNYRDPTNNEPYYVGDRVTFSPLVIDPTKTKIGSGTIEDIRYSLSKDAPDSFFVQASSGIISGSFEEGDELGGDKIFELLAVDKQGAVSTVERFVCNVENVQFKVDEQSKIVRTLPADVASGTVFTNPKRNVIYLVGVTYKFAPLNLSADGAVSGQKGEVTFSVQDAPSGFLISSADGYMQGVPVISDVESTFVVNVFATDERNVNIKVETFTMVIKVRDTDVPTYGPNERDCENSGTRIDSTEFDEEFTCACPTDIDGQSLFEGDNCEEFSARQSQQAADKKKTTTIAIALGVLLAVAICSVAFFRWRAYKIKMKPIDFIARFDEMLATGEIETPYSEDNGLEDGNQNPYAKERRSSQTGVMRQNEGFEWYKVAEMDQNGIVQKKSRHSSVRKRRTAKSSGDAADAAVTYEYSEGGATPATTNNYEYQETELGGGSGRGKNTYEYQGTSDGTGGGSGIEDQAAGYQEFTAAEAAALKKAKEQGDVSSVANTSGGNKDAFNDSYHFAVNGGGGKQKRIPIKGAEPVYNLAGSSELVLGANDFTSTADAEVEQPLYNLAGSNKGMAFPVKPRRGSSTNDAVDIDVDVDVDANQAPTTLLQTPSLGMHSMGGSSTLVAEEVFHGFSDAGLLGIEL
eukprot:gene1240-744_t